MCEREGQRRREREREREGERERARAVEEARGRLAALALCAGLLSSPSPSQEDNGPVATGTLPHCVPPPKASLIQHKDGEIKREKQRGRERDA